MNYDSVDGPAAALMAVGKPPFSENVQDLALAYNLLQQQQPHLLGVGYAANYVSENGSDQDMSLGLGFSGEDYQIQERLGQADWVYVVPEEGTVLWTECWGAPAGKPINEATKAFLNFLNRPDIAAKNAELIWFATTSPEAMSLASEEYQEDKNLFPDESILAKSTTYARMSPLALQQRMRMMYKLGK